MGAAQGPLAERTIRLLDYDPDLGATLRPERRAEARASAQATLIEVPRGPCSAEQMTGGRESAYGALLLDGLLKRTLVLDGVVSAQLLGRGELVRVDGEGSEALIETATRWTVLEPLTIALLDERFLISVRRWPQLVAALFQRVAAQEERRELHRALSQLPRVADRVHALLWLLAERWGHVSSQGVVLRLRLTHELIGQLVGAKRPTVSLALRELEERGTVHRRADGSWLLERAWASPPIGDPGMASEEAGLVPAPEPPAAAAPSLREIRERVERMRGLHVHARQD